jgi:hypothetical protein
VNALERARILARQAAQDRRRELDARRADPAAARRDVEERKLRADFPAPDPTAYGIEPDSRAGDYWRKWAAGKPTASAEHLADVALAALAAGGELRSRVDGVECATGGTRRLGPADVAAAILQMERSAPTRYLGGAL